MKIYYEGGSAVGRIKAVIIKDTIEHPATGEAMVLIKSIDKHSKIYPIGYEWYIPKKIAGLFLTTRGD